MLRTHALSLATVAMGLCAAAPAIAGTFTYSTVAPSGLMSVGATGMTADGRVVGYYYDSQGNGGAYVFANGILTLVTGQKKPLVEFLNVNASGRALAEYADSKHEARICRSKLNGAHCVQVKLPHQNSIGENSVNASGAIAGTLYDYANNPSLTTTAFIASGRQAVELFPPNSFESTATGINDSGVVIGTSFVANQPAQAYTYQNGTFNLFSWPGNGPASYGTIISNTGAVGGYSEYVGTITNYAVIGGLTAQIAVPGAVDTYLINFGPADEVVGNWDLSMYTVNTHGFIYAGGAYHTIDVPRMAGTLVGGVNINGDLFGIASTTGDTYDTIFAATCAPKDRPCTK